MTLEITQLKHKVHRLTDSEEGVIIRFCPSYEHAEVAKFWIKDTPSRKLSWDIATSKVDFIEKWNREARSRRESLF